MRPTPTDQPRQVLVVGRSGRVAKALARQNWPVGYELTFAGRAQLNLLDFDCLPERLEALAPDIIINTAAYTDVDAAESDREAATALNASAPGYLAKAAYDLGADFYHLSTDFVFGRGRGARGEADAVEPLSHYGMSKHEGELRVLANHPTATVIRTAWLFDGFSSNFVTTLLGLAGRSELKVVADQIGSPTHTDHLAQGLIQLVQSMSEARPQILHLVNEGRASRYDQAIALYRALAPDGGAPRLDPISAMDWPTPAQRPEDSQLSTQLWKELGLRPLPQWQEAVALAVDQWRVQQSGEPS